MEVVADAGALCESGVSRTGRDCPVQREAGGRIGMIYRTRNLTGGVVVLQSKAGIHQFLKRSGNGRWRPRCERQSRRVVVLGTQRRMHSSRR